MEIQQNDFGQNSGLLEEMYDQYQKNPKLVSEFWQDYFTATDSGVTPVKAVETANPKNSTKENKTKTPAPKNNTQTFLKPLVLKDEEAIPMRGVAAVIAENMDASLTVPTATSVRTFPTLAMEENRVIINKFLEEQKRKISFTHLIAFAVIKTIEERPSLNVGYGLIDDKPQLVNHEHINLGLAVDMQKPDGSRSLVVPSMKDCQGKNFEEFLTLYEELISKVKNNKLTLEDYAGTTCTITNPGMIGTVHSIPRLMPGQSFILGVGSINYPGAMQAMHPNTLKTLGVSKEITLTNTYDHRVIQGAESGDFLNTIHKHLVGETDFYQDIYTSLGISTAPYKIDSNSAPEIESLSHLLSGVLNQQASVVAPKNDKAINAFKLIQAYRTHGHKKAKLDPLNLTNNDVVSELELSKFDLTLDDMVPKFDSSNNVIGEQKVAELVNNLETAYCNNITGEFSHLSNDEEQSWCYNYAENITTNFSQEQRQQILADLAKATVLENFLATKYVGQKRFGLDGGEALIPMLSQLLKHANSNGVTKSYIGMAHRGRLNVLANIANKDAAEIMREVEGRYRFNEKLSGDVKYHLGHTGINNGVEVTLAPNPSHLEAVGCVILGMARKYIDSHNNDASKVLPIVIHGDAAHSGQGIVAETYSLSNTSAYTVGGSVHIIINNQIGFTTDAKDARSTKYSSDIAKGYDVPIIHVNGDNIEDCVRAVLFAFDFRNKFNKDICIDFICYRKNGHNEGDEPSYTQPVMYKAIKAHESALNIYQRKISDLGINLPDPVAVAKAELDTKWQEARADSQPYPYSVPIISPIVETGSDNEKIQKTLDAITKLPSTFNINPKLAKIFNTYPSSVENNQIEWGLGELFAYGTLLQEGINIRLCGEDVRRGTFSHRHVSIRDINTNERITPINSIANNCEMKVYDSILSEYAALGYEYGYSVESIIEDKSQLTIWEAQFGDFANGAQIIIDQFISSGFDKWQQNSNLVVLLPHGFEGQGPEHSSARIERFLQLCAKENMIVAYPSTSAQMFHLLRRQIHGKINVPLIVITPKKFLRMPQSKSKLSDFTSNYFTPILSDINTEIQAKAERIVFATGKFAHEIMTERDNAKNENVAVVRIEQLSPFPMNELKYILNSFTNAKEFVWAQEEPANAGSAQYVIPYLQHALNANVLGYARKASASPAAGSHITSEHEYEELISSILQK